MSAHSVSTESQSVVHTYFLGEPDLFPGHTRAERAYPRGGRTRSAKCTHYVHHQRRRICSPLYALLISFLHWLIIRCAATDPPGVYKVLTSQSHNQGIPLPSDSIYRVNTGGPLPAGTDTVIMVEDTRLVSTFKDADGADAEEKEVECLVQVPAGENVRVPGSDVVKGDLVLRRGDIILSEGGEVGT